jgi:hypothetical protein
MTRSLALTPLLVASVLIVLTAAGCGGSADNTSRSGGAGTTARGPDPNAPEKSPPGDIPDNQTYVPYAPPGAHYTVKVPEGWSRSTSAQGTTFTDKLNTVTMRTEPASGPMTVQQADRIQVPKLAATAKDFHLGHVSVVDRTAGTAIRITYTATGTPNPVTGKAVTDAIERYIFFRGGKDLVLTLSGPKGADNVDPWRIVTDSVRWTA